MYRKIKLFFLAILCMIILCSCSKKNSRPVYRAVTQIDIVTQYQGQIVGRHYNTPEKMRPVLLYLRLLTPFGNATVPCDTKDDIYLITITLSDDSRHYYRQVSHRYISRENGPYKNINPEQAAELYRILRFLPSDI